MYKEKTDSVVLIVSGDFTSDVFEEYSVELSNKPQSYQLLQNYPNPFNPYTTIKYSIPQEGKVKIQVFDILGREVKTLVNEEKLPGEYSIDFNGSNLASGIYFYRMQANDFSETKKFVLIK